MVRGYFVNLVLVSLLAGCASFDSGTQPPAPIEPSADQSQNNQTTADEVPPITPVAGSSPVTSDAVAALLNQARKHYDAGNYQRSIAIAERAMRLDRYNPSVYLLLGSNYLALKGYAQAEQLVARGLPFAKGQHLIERQLLALMQEIRKAAQY